jgi:hypothetical protein
MVSGYFTFKISCEMGRRIWREGEIAETDCEDLIWLLLDTR